MPYYLSLKHILCGERHFQKEKIIIIIRKESPWKVQRVRKVSKYFVIILKLHSQKCFFILKFQVTLVAYMKKKEKKRNTHTHNTTVKIQIQKWSSKFMGPFIRPKGGLLPISIQDTLVEAPDKTCNLFAISLYFFSK